MVFSEQVRTRADSVPEEKVESIYDRYTSGEKRDQVLRSAAHVLHTHLTTGTPESFLERRVQAYVMTASTYLSDKERSRYLELLKRPFEKYEDDLGAIEDLNRAQSQDSTLLTFGAQHETDDSGAGSAGRRWVVGSIVYIEPKDRLIGPEHSETSPVKFTKDFLDQGGTYLVLDVPSEFETHVTAALETLTENIQTQATDGN